MLSLSTEIHHAVERATAERSKQKLARSLAQADQAAKEEKERSKSINKRLLEEITLR